MDKQAAKSFEELKQVLNSEPLLIYPDFSQPLIVACDTSVMET
jgi:hypothetical protein